MACTILIVFFRINQVDEQLKYDCTAACCTRYNRCYHKKKEKKRPLNKNIKICDTKRLSILYENKSQTDKSTVY